jgi:hypothetical protein
LDKKTQGKGGVSFGQKIQCIMFRIPNESLEKLQKWQEKQEFRALGAIGGSYTYSFTPTTLGVVVKVKNNANGEEIDLTDYENW